MSRERDADITGPGVEAASALRAEVDVPPMLRSVIAEIKENDISVDWDRVEAGLFAKLDSEAQGSESLSDRASLLAATGSRLDGPEAKPKIRSSGQSAEGDFGEMKRLRVFVAASDNDAEAAPDILVSKRVSRPQQERRSSGPAKRLVAAFAIAAAFFVGALSMREASPRHAFPAIVERGATGQSALRILHVGEHVRVPADAGVWVESTGRLRAFLAPGTQARLMDDGIRVRFQLDDGSIAAAIVPVPGGEPFAVDVGTRRVAVHGTHLRVSASQSTLEVAVTEGRAVIGPAVGDARTEGPTVGAGDIARIGQALGSPLVLVRDPAEARLLVEAELSTEGLGAASSAWGAASPVSTATSRPAADRVPRVAARIDPRDLDAPVGNDTGARAPRAPVAKAMPSTLDAAQAAAATPSSEPMVAPSQDVALGAPNKGSPPETSGPPMTTDSAGAAPSPPSVPVQGLTPAETIPTLDKIDVAVRSCVPKANGRITFTVASTMALEVAASGTIVSAHFDPPLRPEISECVHRVLMRVAFPPSKIGPTTVRSAMVLEGK